MADEQSGPPFNKPSPVPKEFARPTLLKLDGGALEAHYRKLLQELGARVGMLGTIFRKAQNRIQDPAKLRRLIDPQARTRRWAGPGDEGLLAGVVHV
jgi:type I restriction enzyme M protein